MSTRYKGKAEKWYSFIDPDYDHVNKREKEVRFEHVWLDKINTQNLKTKKWFKEIVEELESEIYSEGKSDIPAFSPPPDDYDEVFNG